jgi:hypothetical protein
LARLLDLDSRTRVDLIRGLHELALARWRLARLDSPAMLRFIGRTGHAGQRAVPRSKDEVQRVRYAIGVVSARVPWRSDCLVQALAARRWLDSLGISTELFIGVRKSAERGFEAHAWLTDGRDVVTGGDISGFQALVSPQVLEMLTSAGVRSIRSM